MVNSMSQAQTQIPKPEEEEMNDFDFIVKIIQKLKDICEDTSIEENICEGILDTLKKAIEDIFDNAFWDLIPYVMGITR